MWRGPWLAMLGSESQNPDPKEHQMNPIRHFRGNLVAYLALFVALCTGSAYAANQITSKDIAKNAVKAKHIKDGQVRGAELGAGAVTGDKVADDSLTGADIDESSLKLNLPQSQAPAPEKPNLEFFARVVARGFIAGAGPLSAADRCNSVMTPADGTNFGDQVVIAPTSLPEDVVFTGTVGVDSVTYQACYTGAGNVSLNGDVRYMVLRTNE